ncbi:MAG: BTAD domain-containing putative transcriptional regulator [Caldilineaceae bacterium]
MSQLKLYLLGAPRIELDNSPVTLPRRKTTALLVYLLVTRQPQRRDTLATLFWPELGQSAARAALRRDLHVLNGALGPERLHTSWDEIARNGDAPIWIDVERFQQLADQCKSHHPNDDALCEPCVRALTAAAALYQDDFLTDLALADCPDFDEWRAFQADTLRRTFSGIMQKLVQTHEARAAYDEAIPLARRWLAADRTHEPIHRTLMRLFARAGQPAAALRQYAECVQVLDAELGVAPTEETVALVEEIRARRFPGAGKGEKGKGSRGAGAAPLHPFTLSPFHPFTPSSAPRHNLPTQTTTFLGRQEEAEAIQQLLLAQDECRLLTLIGPGGIGKTRLALHVAQTLVAEAPAALADGVYFAPLAGVSDASDMVGAVASAVGCVFRGGDEPQAQLANFLRGKKLLLVVDNFEHLLDGAPLLADLLAAAPELLLLATSREALGLAAEWLYPLGGLTPPLATDPLPVLAENAAVQLFMQRAQRASPGFALNAENAAHVVRVCRLVNGMPLGLELAAAWVNTLGVDEIADEITANIDILASDLRNIPERHRSLRAVFEQTWARLSDGERQTLRRLAIFRGPFTREAAQQVTGVSLLDISALIDKSLCRRQTARFDIHELLRQFAFDRLDEDEKAAALAQHSRYFGQQLQAQRGSLLTGSEPEVLQAVADDYDNILAAWRHLVEGLGRAAEAAEWAALIDCYVPVLAAFFDRRSLFWEGQRIFKQALAALQRVDGAASNSSSALHHLWLQMQIEQAAIGLHLGRFHAAKDALYALLPQLRTLDNQRQLAAALTVLGPAHLRAGEYDASERCLVEAAALYERLGLRLESTLPLINLGLLMSRREAYDKSRLYYQKAAAVYEEVGYTPGLIRCLSNLGSTYPGKAGVAQATAYYERAYQIAVETNNRFWIGIILSNLGDCANEAGNYHEAKEKFAAGLAIFRELSEMRWVTVTLADASFVYIALGELATAAANLCESLTLVLQHKLVVDGIQALTASALVLQQRGQWELAASIAAHVLADERSRSGARQHCTAVLQMAEETLSAADLAAVQFRGRSTPFEQMVQSALAALEESARG